MKPHNLQNLSAVKAAMLKILLHILWVLRSSFSSNRNNREKFSNWRRKYTHHKSRFMKISCRFFFALPSKISKSNSRIQRFNIVSFYIELVFKAKPVEPWIEGQDSELKILLKLGILKPRRIGDIFERSRTINSHKSSHVAGKLSNSLRNFHTSRRGSLNICRKFSESRHQNTAKYEDLV